MVEKVNEDQGDATIEFLHPHGPRKSFNWPSIPDKCFVSLKNILCVIYAPTTITGRSYQITEDEFQHILQAYENYKR